MEEAKLWTGVEGDYWDLIDSTLPGKILHSFRGRAGIRYLFYLSESQCFGILWENLQFAIIEMVYAPSGFTVAHWELGNEDYATDPELATLKSFGGSVVIFDASLVGRDLSITSPGVVPTPPFTDEHGSNTALVQVQTGSWHVFKLRHERSDLLLQGLVFQH
jgi:hypothetical protein